LNLNRDVWVYDDVVGTVITEDNKSDFISEIQFMYDVLNLVINGDHIEYNRLFTDDYRRRSGDKIRDRFTMQQLFEIEMEYLGTGEMGSVPFTDIKLSYKIRNNNGTFRNDLAANEEGRLPVVYTIVYTGGELKIAELLTYAQYMSGLY